MGKAYSLGLRERICAYVSRGHSARAAGRVLVSVPRRRCGLLRSIGRGALSSRNGKAGHRAGLASWRRILTFFSTLCVRSRISRSRNWPLRCPIPKGFRCNCHRCTAPWSAPGCHIKKGLIAAERDRPALRLARWEWITRRQPRMRQEPHRLVFIDETAVKTNLTRLRGRAPVGERLYGAAPFGKWGTQTFIAGLTQNALIAPWVITGAMNGPAFDTYIETQLAPVLDPGTVVILDKPVHPQEPTGRPILEKTGMLVFVPPAVQSRSEPHRDGILEAQSPLATDRCQNFRRPV